MTSATLQTHRRDIGANKLEGLAVADETIDTLVIGGGQSGLAISHRLKQRGVRHLVLERHRIAERWRSERWDGLMFQFPNWSVALPDFRFPQDNPEAFATPAEVIKFIDDYAVFVDPPIRCGVEVQRLRRGKNGTYVAETPNGNIFANNVVVATGPYQRPVQPALLQEDRELFQVHANSYKSPAQLPQGAVLVVGAGASGAQIAEELVRAGRCVFLSVGRHQRLPRRYRGHDITYWLTELGIDRTPVERRDPSRLQPIITGAYGGHTLDFRQFAAQGITLVGHVIAARDGVVSIAGDLADNVAGGDHYYVRFLKLVDDHIETRGLNCPRDPAAWERTPDPTCLKEPLLELDLRARSINSVIWATGYGLDFGWIDLPIFNERGEPQHRDGISELPGLYFLGLQWLARMNSSFLSGVDEDATYLADDIAARRR